MATHTTSLRTYALTRLALALPMVLLLLTLVFILMRVAPGDPISAALGGRLPQEELEQRRAAAGYERPLVVQYFDYLGDVATGDFGTTTSDNRPVMGLITQNGAATLELTLSAMAIAVTVGVAVGLVSGRFRDTPIDLGGRLFGIVIYAAPIFFLGFLAQLVFGKWLGVLPTSGRASPLLVFTLDTPTNLFIIDALIAGDLEALGDILRHLVM